MAEEKKTYPSLPVATWWKLREKFKQTIPGVVTESYLATTLETTTSSARNNVIPPLKTIGLIDDEGKTNQDLAKAWRDDHHYAGLCKDIINRVYPAELLEAVSSPSQNRNEVERWFSIHTGLGESAIRKMSAFYILLSEADVSKRPDKKPAKEQHPKKLKFVPKNIAGQEEKVKQEPTPTLPKTSVDFPSININIEIHISSDASPDQIDKIFESMAKHIYRKQYNQ